MLDYTAGWTPANVPQKIKEAISITAVFLHTNPTYTILERIGDYEVQRLPITKLQSVPLDARVEELLYEFVRPPII